MGIPFGTGKVGIARDAKARCFFSNKIKMLQQRKVNPRQVKYTKIARQALKKDIEANLKARRRARFVKATGRGVGGLTLAQIKNKKATVRVGVSLSLFSSLYQSISPLLLCGVESLSG